MRRVVPIAKQSKRAVRERNRAARTLWTRSPSPAVPLRPVPTTGQGRRPLFPADGIERPFSVLLTAVSGFPARLFFVLPYQRSQRKKVVNRTKTRYNIIGRGQKCRSVMSPFPENRANIAANPWGARMLRLVPETRILQLFPFCVRGEVICS